MMIAVGNSQDNANNFIFDLRRSFVSESGNTQRVGTKERQTCKTKLSRKLRNSQLYSMEYMVKRIGVNTKTKLFIALASLIWGQRGTKTRIKMWSQLGSARIS